MALIYVSAIKMTAEGTVLNSDNCSGVRVGTGEYEIDLGTDMSEEEALFVLQPANGNLINYVIGSAVLRPDGSTVDVKFISPAVPTDSAFTLTAYKFQAEP